MKNFFLIFTLILNSLFIYAAPFGLKMGMSIDKIAELCEESPVFIENDTYLIFPVKKHPVFTNYVVYVNNKTGLYQIRAFSDYITCNNYGTEIQNAFNIVKDRISKTYGTPKIINKIDSNLSEYMKQDKWWFNNLKNGAQQLSAIWGEKTILTDDLVTVVLDCVTNDEPLHWEDAVLVLYYYFKNTELVEDEQDSVF